MGAAVADDEAHAGGAEDASVFPLEERRRVHHLRRDLDNVGAPHRAGRQRRSGRHAAAKADDTDILRIGMEKHRKEAEQTLRQHVTHVRRVDLPVDDERAHAGELPDAYRRDRATFVVQQPPRPQLRLEVVQADVRRVLVRPAREQIEIPRRQQENDRGAKRGGHHHLRETATRRGPRPGFHDPDAERGEDADRCRRAESAVEADIRQQHEPADQRACDRSKRVRRVHARGIRAGGPPVPGRRRRRGSERQRERRTESARHGQEQQGDGDCLPRHDAAERGVGIRHLRGDDQRKSRCCEPACSRRGDGSDHEHRAEPGGRPGRTASQASAGGGADREAHDEGGHHGRERVRGRTDNEHEEPRPGDFVDERDKPRDGRGRGRDPRQRRRQR